MPINVGWDTCRILSRVCLVPPPPPFRSAREGRNVWGDRRPSLLQQEQDWGEISNGQMFLFPGAGSRHHPGHALLRGRCVPLHAFYNFCAFCFTSAIKVGDISLLKKKAKEAVKARTIQGVLALKYSTKSAHCDRSGFKTEKKQHLILLDSGYRMLLT